MATQHGRSKRSGHPPLPRHLHVKQLPQPWCFLSVLLYMEGLSSAPSLTLIWHLCGFLVYGSTSNPSSPEYYSNPTNHLQDICKERGLLCLCPSQMKIPRKTKDLDLRLLRMYSIFMLSAQAQCVKLVYCQLPTIWAKGKSGHINYDPRHFIHRLQAPPSVTPQGWQQYSFPAPFWTTSDLPERKAKGRRRVTLS